MKGIAFFIGVFSAGLVIFLLFTGQISTLFTGGPDDETGQIQSAENNPENPNQVSHTALDPNTGRVRFTLSGNLDDESLSMDQIDAPTTLSNAVVKIPIHGSPGDGTSSSGDTVVGITMFELATGKISYRPHTKSKHFEMRGGIEGKGDDGSRLRTDSIDVDFGPERDALLVGRDPVEIAFPAFRLFGSNGLEGTIDSQVGLTRLIIAPPVVVALDRSQGGALLGLGTSEAATGSAEEQIFLISKAPLVIDRLRNEAIFEGEVVVFPAGLSATLNPAPDPNAAVSRFECEGLRLSFDSKTVRFVEAEAKRGTLPVRGYLTDSSGSPYELNADALLWTESAGRVDLSEEVSIRGARGVFRSKNATLFPRDRRVELREQVMAELRTEMRDDSNAGDSPHPTDWIITADRAEFTYGSRAGTAEKRGGSVIERLRAWSNQAGRLTIRERRDDGARLDGSHLTYDARAGTVVVTGPEGSPESLRPTFKNGRSRVGSQRMTVSIEDRSILFSGQTQGEIYGWDVRDRLQENPTSATPSWLLERGADDYADVRCEELRLRWDRAAILQEVVASGTPGGDAMSLEIRGADWCRCGGERFEWKRELQRVLLSGPPGGQKLETAFADLRGEKIDFDLAKLELRATDSTEAHVRIPRSAVRAGANADSGHDLGIGGGSEITIDSPELRLQLAERPRTKASDEATAGTSTAGDMEDESPELMVVSASAWNPLGGHVTVVDGALAVAGQQVHWDGASQRIRLDGDGQQRIFRFGPEGIDDLTADRIEIDFVRGQATLEGRVRASLHQSGQTTVKSSSSVLPASSADCVWRVEAGRVVIEFDGHGVASSDGADRRLVLQHFEATQGVRVSQAETQVVLIGTMCRWERRDQTLRILDPDGQAMQTVQHGVNRRNSIIARQIHVTPEVRNGRFESVWVFMQDEVLGTFRPEHATEDRNSPDSFRLISDNLLVKLSPDSENAIQSGSAWGHVVFQGGDYQVFSSQALYRETEHELSFFGQPNEQVQLAHRGKNLPGAERLSLRRSAKGGFTVAMQESSPWRGDEIQRVMRQLEREDRVR